MITSRKKSFTFLFNEVKVVDQWFLFRNGSHHGGDHHVRARGRLRGGCPKDAPNPMSCVSHSVF
jgi:hypothetical protein